MPRGWRIIARKATQAASFWLLISLIAYLGMSAVVKIEATGARLLLAVVVFGVAFGAASLVERILRDYASTDRQPNGEPTEIWAPWHSQFSR